MIYLAARALVRRAYEEPRVFGQRHGHDLAVAVGAAGAGATDVAAADSVGGTCAPETGRAFVESDPVGGRDPYGASKAAAELVTAAYRESFFADGAAVASVRAGNVIGGGDWAPDRIIPDSVRALVAGEQIVVRNPNAIRPWQHVLEPLSGYLWLGSLLLADGHRYEGPELRRSSSGPISRPVVDRFLAEWGARRDDPGQWRPAA